MVPRRTRLEDDFFTTLCAPGSLLLHSLQSILVRESALNYHDRCVCVSMLSHPDSDPVPVPVHSHSHFHFYSLTAIAISRPGQHIQNSRVNDKTPYRILLGLPLLARFAWSFAGQIPATFPSGALNNQESLCKRIIMEYLENLGVRSTSSQNLRGGTRCRGSCIQFEIYRGDGSRPQVFRPTDL